MVSLVAAWPIGFKSTSAPEKITATLALNSTPPALAVTIFKPGLPAAKTRVVCPSPSVLGAGLMITFSSGLTFKSTEQPLKGNPCSLTGVTCTEAFSSVWVLLLPIISRLDLSLETATSTSLI